jgi:hypothetical protein
MGSDFPLRIVGQARLGHALMTPQKAAVDDGRV